MILLVLLALLAAWGIRDYMRAAELVRLSRECQLAEHGKQWQKLQSRASRWRSLDPHSEQALMHLATAKKSLEDWLGFVEAVEQLPVTNPYIVPSLAAAGDVLIDHVHDVRRAERLFLGILTIDPNNRHAYQRLIFLYSMTLQRAKLHVAIKQAIQLRCEPPEASVYLLTLSALNFSNGLFQTAQWQAGTADWEPLDVAFAIYVAKAKPNESNNLARMVDGSVPKYGTLGLLDAMSDRYPDNIELLSFFIELAMQDVDTEAVQRRLGSWPAVAQNDPRYWRYMGWLQDMSNNLDSSLTSYRNSIALQPLDWRTRNELASVERTLGIESAAENAQLASRGKQLERSVKELTSALAIDSTQITLLKTYAEQCGDSNAIEAIQRLDRGQ